MTKRSNRSSRLGLTGLAILMAFAMVAAACGGSDSSDAGPQTEPTVEVGASPEPTAPADSTATPEPADPTATPEPAATATPTPPPEPVALTLPRVRIAGPEEVVFDWTTDQCEPEHIPDIATRAFRGADDLVQLTIGHYVTYRMVGPDLDDLDSMVNDCSGPVLTSDYDPDPAQFNDSEWIGSPYTLDGETIYAVVHNEYRGDTHDAVRPGQCPSSDRLTCLDTSFTMAVSTDGGQTYADIAPAPGHLIASLPYVFDDQGVPSGLRQPSDIIEGPDGHYYLFANISDYPREDQWVCVMRTDDLADPGSWRYWNGTDFAGVFLNPYLDEVDSATDKCAPLSFPTLSGSVQETVFYDEALESYVMMGMSNDPFPPNETWGVYYSLSDDLLTWSMRELLIELPMTNTVADSRYDVFYAYPSVIDSDSASRNFETSDGTAYLYITLFNGGAFSLDRDLIRWPITLANEEVERPAWTFDTDGDTEGWFAFFAVENMTAADGMLTFESTGVDPHIGSETFAMPAGETVLRFRMRVTGGPATSQGQVFFATQDGVDYTEAKSLLFDVTADGEWHDYELDFATVPGWFGVISTIRLDPIGEGEATIDIDEIAFGVDAG